MKYDEFGDRMKMYEKEYTDLSVDTSFVLCVRLDGKGFSRFTRGFKKPFDSRLSDSMVDTTRELVKWTHASLGYTQSDEITLIFKLGEKSSEYMFGGKVSKLNSVLASFASVNFNHFISKKAPENYAGKGLALFDCRSWAVPDLTEASNVVLWRVQDAKKNSVSALFRWTAGHKDMFRLNQQEMKDYLIANNGVDWNKDIPNKYKYGTFLKRVTVERELDQFELDRIPEKNKPARSTLVKRTDIEEVDIGYYGDLSLKERIDFI